MNSRYQIIGEINQGGVGVVLKAWDTKLQRNVAIKRFLSREQREALGNVDGDLLKEASTLSAMHHPNIVSVYDVNMEAESGPEVIMEYLNGQDLEQAVSQAALTLDDFYQVAQQTLDALSNAHRMNLLHRDIKPSNIQVTWLANGKFVSKFVDFGLAKFFEKPSKQTVRQDGTVLGSIYYMAPEQFERQPLDNRSDIYSLGCVFYFALTMHRPFEGATVTDVINGHLYGRAPRMRDYRPNVPRDLEKWVEWLMSRSPDARPADAELALTTLRQIMSGQTPEGVPGVQSISQPVSAAPMRTGQVNVPQKPAFTATGKSAAAAASPAGARPKSGAVKKAAPKKKSSPVKPLLISGVAAAVAVGAYIAVSGGGKQETAKEETKPGSAVDILNAAKREEALHKAKAELADLQARQAIAQTAPEKTAMTTTTPAAATTDLSRPPENGLVMWFDAGKGTRVDDKGTAALSGGPAGQWMDNAAAGGTAVFQYTGSGTPNKEQNYPTLITSPAGRGLRGARPVLSFDGTGDTLCVRDKDKIGDPMGRTFEGGRTSVLMVFRAAGPDAEGALIQARCDKPRNVLWALGVKNKGLIAQPAHKEPLQLPGSENEFRIASFVADRVDGKFYLGLINSDGQKTSRDEALRVDAKLSTDMLRMGTADNGGTERIAFAGDVAEVLIYDRALDREERHHAENYLRLKHFGSSGPTVTANGK